MTTRFARGLVAAGIAAALSLSSLAVFAAMPVGGFGIQHESAIVQVAKKQKQKKMTPREEADASAKSGTVPKRYRSSVPKEYQQYIPFSK